MTENIVRGQNQNVIMDLSFQVLLITGGEAPNYPVAHKSTEILIPGSSSWKQVGDLPQGLWQLRGISLNNEIILSGKVVNYLLIRNV